MTTQTQDKVVENGNNGIEEVMVQVPLSQLMRNMQTENELLRQRIAQLEKNGNGGSGNSRVRHTAQPVIDTKTGTVYQSKSAAGMAVIGEYKGQTVTHEKTGAKRPVAILNKNGEPNHFAWYDIVGGNGYKGVDPSRFVPATEENIKKFSPAAKNGGK